MTIAPSGSFAERQGEVYERKMAVNSRRRGPLRFMEGVATDTNVPNDFEKGVMQGYMSAPGHPNHNLNVYEKPAQETMQERAHLGSAAWTEAPTMLGDFSAGAMADYNSIQYQEVVRPGTRLQRSNPATVRD